MITLLPPGSQSIVDQEIVSSHVRSLQPGHLTDVQTTNQHIVKPWFNGKIDFSPPVPELAERAFRSPGDGSIRSAARPLPRSSITGGCTRVNLFVWPAKDAAERSFVKDGFAVTRMEPQRASLRGGVGHPGGRAAAVPKPVRAAIRLVELADHSVEARDREPERLTRIDVV